MLFNLGNEKIILNDFKYFIEQLNDLKQEEFVIIIDENIKKLYKDYFSNTFLNIKYIIINSNESTKNIYTALDIIQQLLEYNVKRGQYIIAFGGGVLLDIVGFVGSIYYRGLNIIYIPTTLLSMVDASIGGKTAINYQNTKNVIGTFKEPNIVYIDTNFLNTLDKTNCLSGFGEIIKYKLLDKDFIIDTNIEQLIYNSLLFKYNYVKGDLYDNNKRMFLNLGHTFGHLIELDLNISHGYSVIHGIYAILKLELDLNLISNNVVDYYLNVLKSYNIELINIDYKKYIINIFNDKKNINNILNLIFINNDLKPYIYKITKEELYDKLIKK